MRRYLVLAGLAMTALVGCSSGGAPTLLVTDYARAMVDGNDVQAALTAEWWPLFEAGYDPSAYPPNALPGLRAIANTSLVRPDDTQASRNRYWVSASWRCFHTAWQARSLEQRLLAGNLAGKLIEVAGPAVPGAEEVHYSTRTDASPTVYVLDLVFRRGSDLGRIIIDLNTRPTVAQGAALAQAMVRHLNEVRDGARPDPVPSDAIQRRLLPLDATNALLGGRFLTDVLSRNEDLLFLGGDHVRTQWDFFFVGLQSSYQQYHVVNVLPDHLATITLWLYDTPQHAANFVGTDAGNLPHSSLILGPQLAYSLSNSKGVQQVAYQFARGDTAAEVAIFRATSGVVSPEARAICQKAAEAEYQHLVRLGQPLAPPAQPAPRGASARTLLAAPTGVSRWSPAGDW